MIVKFLIFVKVNLDVLTKVVLMIIENVKEYY